MTWSWAAPYLLRFICTVAVNWKGIKIMGVFLPHQYTMRAHACHCQSSGPVACRPSDYCQKRSASKMQSPTTTPKRSPRLLALKWPLLSWLQMFWQKVSRACDGAILSSGAKCKWCIVSAVVPLSTLRPLSHFRGKRCHFTWTSLPLLCCSTLPCCWITPLMLKMPSPPALLSCVVLAAFCLRSSFLLLWLSLWFYTKLWFVC